MCSRTDDTASLDTIVFFAAILDLSVIKLCYITYLKCIQDPPAPSADRSIVPQKNRDNILRLFPVSPSWRSNNGLWLPNEHPFVVYMWHICKINCNWNISDVYYSIWVLGCSFQTLQWDMSPTSNMYTSIHGHLEFWAGFDDSMICLLILYEAVYYP